MAKYLVLAATLLGTAACGDTWGQRAVTGKPPRNMGEHRRVRM